MCVLLAEHPDQRAALAADPSLVPNAVEESLRYEPPSPVQGRTLTDEVTLYDTTLPAGSKVLLLTGSAGRDERKYPDPDRYDVRRRFRHVRCGSRVIHLRDSGHPSRRSRLADGAPSPRAGEGGNG